MIAALVLLAAAGLGGAFTPPVGPTVERLPGPAGPDPAKVARRLAEEAATGAAAAGWPRLQADELSCMAEHVVDALGASRAGQLRWDDLWSPGRDVPPELPSHLDALEHCVQVPAWLSDVVGGGVFDPEHLACFSHSVATRDAREVAAAMLVAGSPAPAAHRFSASGCGDDGTRQRTGRLAGLLDMGTVTAVSIRDAAQHAGVVGPLADGRIDLRRDWLGDQPGLDLLPSGVELGWPGGGPVVCVHAAASDEVAATARQAPGVSAGPCPR